MTGRSKVAERAFSLAQPVIEGLGCELVDAEYKKEGSYYYLRLFVDRKGGIGIDDCEAVSRAVDPLFDKDLGVVPDYFEVSSPGLNRPLKTLKDFLRHEGEEVEVKLFAPIEESKSWTGRIRNADEDSLTIVVTEGGERLIKFPVEAISAVKRMIRF